MTVRTQTASAYFPKGSEMLYRFHSCIDSSLYPHVHDYYEITFVTEGSMDISLNQYSCTIKEGYFILVRPDDVHTKAPHKLSLIHISGAEAGHGDGVQKEAPVLLDLVILIPWNMLEGMLPLEGHLLPRLDRKLCVDLSRLQLLHH